MSGYLLLLLTIVGVIRIETPGLLKRGRIKELVIFYLMLLIGAAVSMLWLSKQPLPNPMHWIKVFY
ncbi:hypothetical protein [Paenibacillus sp. HB172176]|uniref:hypothetical protein n=1 Tax=Paenibacillus sp. HB172176 TaxID=2493690 RepID=UPI00143B8AEA|nr:hypothetical protein [Paenibacillus sp. HB172176]